MRRLAALLFCVGIGTAVGVAVRLVVGSDAGFVAIPLAVAAGWMFVADPSRCQPPTRAPGTQADDDEPPRSP